MARQRIALEEWLKEMRRVTRELSEGALQFPERRTLPLPASAAEHVGSYIAVMSAFDSMHVGLTASSAGCRVLARSLLNAPADEDLSDAEVVDGVNELMNIVAGKVKARLAGADGTMRLGLPMFLTTPVRLTDRMERATDNVTFGPVACRLLVFRERRAA